MKTLFCAFDTSCVGTALLPNKRMKLTRLYRFKGMRLFVCRASARDRLALWTQATRVYLMRLRWQHGLAAYARSVRLFPTLVEDHSR